MEKIYEIIEKLLAVNYKIKIERKIKCIHQIT